MFSASSTLFNQKYLKIHTQIAVVDKTRCHSENALIVWNSRSRTSWKFHRVRIKNFTWDTLNFLLNLNLWHNNIVKSVIKLIISDVKQSISRYVIEIQLQTRGNSWRRPSKELWNRKELRLSTGIYRGNQSDSRTKTEY